MVSLDLAGLDRALQSAARALAVERSGPDPHLDRVWVQHRPVARKSLYDDLRAADLPAEIKHGLMAWVATLTVARVTAAEEEAVARATDEVRVPLLGSPPRLVSWSDGWSLFARSRDRGQARAALAAVAAVAPRIAPLVHALTEARSEALSRLEGAAVILGADEDRESTALARRMLDASGDLARDVLGRARKKDPDPWPLVHDVLMAADASEGWPPRPSQRWLEDLFGARTLGLSLELSALPEPVGAASFARAMRVFGEAYRRAVAAPSAVARPPRFVDMYGFGGAFAALATSPVFHRRKLGLSRRVADAQARSVSAALLVALRLECAAWLNRVRAIGTPELGILACGEELPAQLEGAWPRRREDGSARLRGWLAAESLLRKLEDEHDEDWFDNPRAWAELRGRPPPVALDEGSPARTARAFEVMLS